MNETCGSLKEGALRAGKGKSKQTTTSICIRYILTRIYIRENYWTSCIKYKVKHEVKTPLLFLCYL